MECLGQTNPWTCTVHLNKKRVLFFGRHEQSLDPARTCLCVYIVNSLRNYVFIFEFFFVIVAPSKGKKEPGFNHQNLACVPRHINSFLSQNIAAVYMKDSSVYRMYLLLADAVQILNQQGKKRFVR